MKRISTIMLAVLMAASVFVGAAAAGTSLSDKPTQIVPTTKKVTGKTYRKGRWVTKTTYRHGRKITKKVWIKGKHIGAGVGHKATDIVMGPKKPKP